MVFNTIDRLREKPEHHRRRVAYGISALITIFIFVVWLSVHIPGGSAPVVAQAPTETEESSESPFETLSRGVASVYEAIKGMSGDEEIGSFSEEYERIKSQVEGGDLEFFQGDSANPAR
ncbi:MAG: hypothetical protein A2653_02925 [Candidatus Zambryskibacteria bacterium RIFCSPHIGHO2_01_FULL_43_25]|uniref:Uncharacterized protein n=1 Tax=Candidatus Zambryskibacteria bacterium RIFCSPLOWO2_01_FULL_45_21 TaxID=1802761 RepID=A0A1G2U096_9BACT|nr:MAG: hypothetical protein A2653_02925 [Candidatus Zambryskibacteria bacterium RIFCSPHIGHO2_01_FULL_43_25]OHB00933.1 MAG: hypothetical protein A3E94_00125 [Candidatus Zambryskibacteria bacterium RIFCSPHIGHO2_12_FULL_44_12b]OHB02961.1 MAG: hypothetical protein A3B14_00770 [Candidatus Zambryskibacteria bacterium RIFCSPLOWO2_01_FULL_45_21]